MSGKREDYLSWDEYFMGIAVMTSTRSKDPHNAIGACIISNDKKILSTGYNGLPKGMNDDEFDWLSTGEKTGIKKYIKNNYVVHAEINAILNHPGHMSDLKGSTLYVTWFPCHECAAKIVQAGIKKVVYLRMYSDMEDVEISKIILDAAGVEYVPYGKENSKEEVEKSTDIIKKELKMLKAVKEQGKKDEKK